MPTITGLRPQQLNELLKSIISAPISTYSGVPPNLLASSAAALQKAAQGCSAEKTKYMEVEDPDTFDHFLHQAQSKERKTFALFTAALKEDGKPWCPDARAAEPVVFEVLDTAQPSVTVLLCRLPRDAWNDKANPHPYRAKLGLTNLPTLVAMSQNGTGDRLVEGACKDQAGVRSLVAGAAHGESKKRPRMPVVTIAGWSACGFFRRARDALRAKQGSVVVDVQEFPNKLAYREWLTKAKAKEGALASDKAQRHTSSPIVWLDDMTFIGGCDDTMKFLSHL